MSSICLEHNLYNSLEISYYVTELKIEAQKKTLGGNHTLEYIDVKL